MIVDSNHTTLSYEYLSHLYAIVRSTKGGSTEASSFLVSVENIESFWP